MSASAAVGDGTAAAAAAAAAPPPSSPAAMRTAEGEVGDERGASNTVEENGGGATVAHQPVAEADDVAAGTDDGHDAGADESSGEPTVLARGGGDRDTSARSPAEASSDVSLTGAGEVADAAPVHAAAVEEALPAADADGAGPTTSADAGASADADAPRRAEKRLGIFCTLCLGEMASRDELMRHLADSHPNALDVSESELAALQASSAGAMGRHERLTERFVTLRGEQRAWEDLSEDALPAKTTKLLTALTALLYSGPSGDAAERRRKYEARVVEWQADSAAAACGVCCRQAFAFGMMGKHHCRVCGRVICADCSQFLKAQSVHHFLSHLSKTFRVGLGVVVSRLHERIGEEQASAVTSGDMRSPSPSRSSSRASRASQPPTSPVSPGAAAAAAAAATASPTSPGSRRLSTGSGAADAADGGPLSPRVAELRCCIACRVVIEQAQEAVREFQRHTALRKADAARTSGVDPVSAEVTRVFRSIDRVLPRYNDLANALWAGEALSQYDEAVKMLAKIEAAARQLDDWTKIANDAVRFAGRDIEARVATAVLARIDAMSVQDRAIALPTKTQVAKWTESRVRRICPDDVDPSHAVVWENQRRWPGSAYLPHCLFEFDPDPFTRPGSAEGVAALEDVAPEPGHAWAPGSDWLISVSCACDEDGWQYSLSFAGGEPFAADRDFLFHFVRRRMWCRPQVPDVDVAALARASTSPSSPSSALASSLRHPQQRGAAAAPEPTERMSTREPSSAEAEEPPPWNDNRDAKVCQCCRVTAFSFLERKHHCRHCGRVVCSACSTHRTHHSWYKGQVRTCDGCLKSIVRRASLEQADALADGVPGQCDEGAAGAGATTSETVEVFECQRWAPSGGWSADHLEAGESAWQTCDGERGYSTIASFEAAYAADPAVVGWADDEWAGADGTWLYAFSFSREGGGVVQWVEPADAVDARELEAQPNARRMFVRRRQQTRAARRSRAMSPRRATSASMHMPPGSSVRLQSYLLRRTSGSSGGGGGNRSSSGSGSSANADQWVKAWYVLQGDALRAFDSEDYTIVRWRVYVSAFESARALHFPGKGEPSQVVLTTNIDAESVVFATATPELADSWAVALQCAIVSPLMTGRLFHRDAGGKSKTWHDWYWELRGKSLVYWEREGDPLQKGTLSLAAAQTIKRSVDAASMHLRLVSRKGQLEHHELRAETSLLIEEWFLAISQSMATDPEAGKGFS